MNTLILNWRDPKNPKSGGAEIVTMEHAKAWVKAGHNVTWLTASFKGAKKQEVIDGVTIVRKGNPISVLLLAPFFYLLSKVKFDVVIDEIHGLPFFTPLYVRKSKKIAFIHEVAGEIWDYMYPFPINIIGKMLESLYFQLYKQIPFWTDAQSTIDDLVKHGIPRKNCTAIPCPINNDIVKNLPQKEKQPIYIFVSRLVKMKGIERVLDAFVKIFQEDSTAKLWIVGGGDDAYVNFLESKISQLGKVYKLSNFKKSIKFWGKVSEQKKLELMGKAHLLLHASVKEGWGLVVVEAASQGTPSVVYKVAGLVDSVKDGKTGIIVKENTPFDLGKKALELVKNEKAYRRLQERGISWAKNLTWDKVTKESLHLISTV